MRVVTLSELQGFIQKNLHHTWFTGDDGGFDVMASRDKRAKVEATGQQPTLTMKYINFNLDTRDMKIFRLNVSGAGRDFSIDFRDEGDGSILDELQRIIDARSADLGASLARSKANF